MGLEETSRFGEVQLLCNVTTLNPGRYLSNHCDLLDAQFHLIWQAQALLRKTEIYQKIDVDLQKISLIRPNVYCNLKQIPEGDYVTSLHRDAAVSNMRLLNIFYGFSPDTFIFSASLLDRLLGKVKAQCKFLSSISMACFHLAARLLEKRQYVPSEFELVKIGQCVVTAADLMNVEEQIVDKLNRQLPSVTVLSLLSHFCELFAESLPALNDLTMFTNVVAKLEVLMCDFEFTKYRAETIALSLLSLVLQDMGVLEIPVHATAFQELQYYCQVTPAETLVCRQLIVQCLQNYSTQPTKRPHLQLAWNISKRTLAKLKPSTRILMDLEPIMEDECLQCTSSSDDAGPFDSDVDDMTHIKCIGRLSGTGRHLVGMQNHNFGEMSEEVCDDEDCCFEQLDEPSPLNEVVA